MAGGMAACWAKTHPILNKHMLPIGLTLAIIIALGIPQIGIAVEGATDAAQAAADIVLTRPGLSPIFTAIMESRRIFKRLKSYVIYRICVTVQVVAFLCIVSFVYNDTFDALYIILLALFHDLTIVTIAYAPHPFVFFQTIGPEFQKKIARARRVRSLSHAGTTTRRRHPHPSTRR